MRWLLGFFRFLYARHKVREAEIVRRMNGGW